MFLLYKSISRSPGHAWPFIFYLCQYNSSYRWHSQNPKRQDSCITYSYLRFLEPCWQRTSCSNLQLQIYSNEISSVLWHHPQQITAASGPKKQSQTRECDNVVWYLWRRYTNKFCNLLRGCRICLHQKYSYNSNSILNMDSSYIMHFQTTKDLTAYKFQNNIWIAISLMTFIIVVLLQYS